MPNYAIGFVGSGCSDSTQRVMTLALGLRVIFLRQSSGFLLNSSTKYSNSGSGRPPSLGRIGAGRRGRSGMKPISRHSRKLHRRSSGQALIESALIIPFVLAIILNAVNFGYFYYVAQNMTAAIHSGALYSILGSATPGAPGLPSPGTSSDATGIANLIYQDMLGALPSSATAAVRVCSITANLTTPTTGTGANTKTNCSTIDPSGTAVFPSIDADPQAPAFLLNRVDVAYTFSPLIPGTPFGAVLLANPVCSSSGGNITCSFQSHVSMREMN